MPTNIPNLNMTSSEGLSPSMQTYYDRRLIASAKDILVYMDYAQKRRVPKRGGNVAQFSRYLEYAPKVSPLPENAIPDGEVISQMEVTVPLYPRGNYSKISTPVDLMAIDPVVNDEIIRMGENAALSLDTIIKDVVHGGANVQYAGDKTARFLLGTTDVITSKDLRKAARFLKNNRARPYARRGGKPYYVAVIDANTEFDLQDDETWQEVNKYQNSGVQIYSGEIGTLFGIIVARSTNGNTFEADEIPTGLTTAASSAYTAGTKTLTLSASLSAGDATALTGKRILIGDKWEDKVVSASGTSVVLITGYPGTAADLNGTAIYGGGAGAQGMPITSTVVLGADAYGTVELEGEQGARSIVKSAKSGGTSDPLEQFSTVGWKHDAFNAVLLRDDWIVRIEHAVSE